MQSFKLAMLTEKGLMYVINHNDDVATVNAAIKEIKRRSNATTTQAPKGGFDLLWRPATNKIHHED